MSDEMHFHISGINGL